MGLIQFVVVEGNTSIGFKYL